MVRLWAMVLVMSVSAAGAAHGAGKAPTGPELLRARGGHLQTTAVIGKARRMALTRPRALQLDLADARALARPAVRGSAGGARRTAVASLVARQSRTTLADAAAAVRAVAVESRSRGSDATMRANAVAAAPFPVPLEPLPWLDLGGDKAPVAVPVTDRLTVGLGYRFVNGEDLAVGDPSGSITPDYASHNVLLQAHWQF